MTTRGQLRGDSASSILAYVYLLVAITIVTSAIVATTLIRRQYQVSEIRQHAQDYHLKTRLDVSRIQSELSAIEQSFIKSFVETPDAALAAQVSREHQRSMHIVIEKLQAIQQAYRRFGGTAFEPVVSRLASSIEELDDSMPTQETIAVSKMIPLDAIGLVRTRCEQLDLLHEIAFRDESDEMRRLIDSRRFARIVSAITIIACGVILAFVLFTRRAVINQGDVERRLAQRAMQAELLYRAVTMAENTKSYHQAVQRCLEIVGQMTGWPIGHAYWLPEPGNAALQSSSLWTIEGPESLGGFREESEELRFEKGVGLPGSIWESDRPVWIVNAQVDPMCVRGELCVQYSLKAAFGFPLKIKGQTQAIVEFFNDQEMERDETILLMAQSVGEQVGRVIERIEAEDAARQRHEKVQEELDKAKQELILQTRLAAVGQMSAQVAHEMRNPLGAISNAIYFLQRNSISEPAKLAQYMNLMSEEITTCNHFIDDLLNLTRRRRTNRERIDLKELVFAVRRRLVDVDHANCRFEIRCEPEPFEIFVDRRQFVQVLSNLIKNSIDAMATEGGEIIVDAKREGPFDVVSVEDSGPGVPPENRDEIFEVFFTTKSSGTGIGLAVCKQIVEQHGGTIQIVERESARTAFEVRLPIHQDRPVRAALEQR